jgi:hypothetical protein
VWLGSFWCPTLFRRRRCRRRLGVLCTCRRRRRRGGEFILVSDFRDGLIKAITSVQGFRDGFDGEVVGQSQGRGIEALLIEPAHVGLGPGISAAVTEPLAHQQSGDPVPGPHQVPAGIFSDPDQIQDCFLSGIRDGDLGDLVQFQQPGQVQGVVPVCFHPVPGWSLELGRGRNQTIDAGLPQGSGQDKAGRPGFVNHSKRARDRLDPGENIHWDKATFEVWRSQLRMSVLTWDWMSTLSRSSPARSTARRVR